MSGELRTSVVVDLSGNLERRARRYSRSIRYMSRSAQRSLRDMGGAAHLAGRGLDAIGNRWVALGTGAGAVGTARMLVRHEERLTRLGIQAQLSQEQIKGLNNEIFRTAQMSDVRVDPGEITSAVEAIVEKTGDLKFARDNLRGIALAIQASGGAGQNIGEIFAEIQKMDVRNPEKVLGIIDTLNEQGKAGAFTLQNLARLGPRVITAYTATGRTGAEAMKEMGAALQVIRMGTGNAEQSATAFEAVLRTLTDDEKLKKLRELGGVEVFDAEKLKEGERVLRPINELLVDIVEAAQGDRGRIGQVFDAEALRAFNQMAGEFRRNGSVDSIERFMQVQGDGTTTMQDSARAAGTASAALTNLFTAWKRFADANLTGPIEGLTDALNALSGDDMQTLLKVLGTGALGLGGLMVGRKLYQGAGAVGRFVGLGRKRGGRAGGVGGAAAAAAGAGGFPIPLPVVVVGGKGALGGGRGRRGRGSIGGGALGVGAAALGGYGLGSWIEDEFISGTKLSDNIGRTIARVLANLGNDEARSALQSGGGSMRGELNIRIYQDARARIDSMRGEGMDMDVDTGPMMPVGGA